ncbi:MAG TPA: prepilin-type N-terminal cleavage/methylation domain-containing protein [Gemmatimonadaceae bacterium]|nr:prepilin-type N-terminal cleavage/methylation domain-containing protein [Gemmatimonadaceae bacterium]
MRLSTSSPRADRAPRGFTLAEMIIAITMLAMFGASAITFYLRSLRSVTNTAGRNDAQQTASYALDFVDHDMRVAGMNLAPNQPRIVAAGSWFIVFNGDLVTADTSASAGGAYYDASVQDTSALAWQANRAQNLPGSSIAYPETTYTANGVVGGPLGNAETITYYLRADSSAPANSNLYILWRQINSNTPTMVANNLYSSTNGVPPVAFTYYYQNPATNALVQFPSTSIPVWRNSKAAQARMDSIKEVRITFTGAFKDSHNQNQVTYRPVNEIVKIPNTYMSQIAQCPGPPNAVASLTANPSTNGVDTVGLTWPQAPDDGQGLGTDRIYLIYQKRHVDTVYTQIGSLNAQATATYDYNISSGLTLGTAYDFAVAVRDCTPSLSPITTKTNITPN